MNRSHYYIYPRDKRGVRTGHTICVLLKDGKIFHGTALCSIKDQFSRAEGRKRALERAEETYSRYLERCQAKV